VETLYSIAVVASFVISGGVVFLNGIAPLTKTTKDDRVRDFLEFVQHKILSVLLPFLAAQVKPKDQVEVK